MERWEIAIIGAGAAGLMAAQAAAKAQRAQGRPVSVVVLEGNPKPGKKLLATGNGRCNLTNLDAGPARYHGDVALAAPLLEACPPSRVLEEFQAMGLLCRADSEGRVYPRNLQAAAVLQILRQACQELGVTLACDWGVASLAREDLESARNKLMDILSNYCGYKNREVILVFDGYRVKGSRGERFQYHNLYVVYTRENDTGDMYIESLVRGIGKHDRVWVATSDSLIQLSAFRTGVLRLSARELKAEVDSACGEMTALLQAMDRAQTVARQQEKRGQIPEKLLRLLPE